MSQRRRAPKVVSVTSYHPSPFNVLESPAGQENKQVVKLDGLDKIDGIVRYKDCELNSFRGKSHEIPQDLE